MRDMIQINFSNWPATNVNGLWDFISNTSSVDSSITGQQIQLSQLWFVCWNMEASTQHICIIHTKFGKFFSLYIMNIQNIQSIININSVPWNQNTPLGYCVLSLYCHLIGQAYLFGCGVFLVMFISLCRYHQTFSEIYQHIGRSARSKQVLVDTIEFHGDIKT